MHYAIIATLGPVTNEARVWDKLLKAGATTFRLNTSHLQIDDVPVWMQRLEDFFQQREQKTAAVEVVLDLQGSKWRLGELEPRELKAGEQLTLVLSEAVDPDRPGQAETLPIPRSDFFHAAQFSDGEVVLNDARVRLSIERMEKNALKTRVMQGGPISARKGVTLSGTVPRTEALCEKDEEIAARTRQWSFASYALSYVKDAVEMARYRDIFASQSGTMPKLIAKLERARAMQEAAAIARQTSELWVCRGDLGAEMGQPEMAQAVYQLAKTRAAIPAPVMMAGQVLEHMTNAPDPTRSEVCYLHDCLQWGCDGFVLSDETAIGKYAVESCRTAAMFRQTGKAAQSRR